MSNQAPLKEISRQLKQKKGNVRGDIILGNFSYIRQEKGEIGLEKVKKKVKEFGYSVDINRIKPLEWYPESLSVMVFLLLKRFFNGKTKIFLKWGNRLPSIRL